MSSVRPCATVTTSGGTTPQRAGFGREALDRFDDTLLEKPFTERVLLEAVAGVLSGALAGAAR